MLKRAQRSVCLSLSATLLYLCVAAPYAEASVWSERQKTLSARADGASGMLTGGAPAALAVPADAGRLVESYSASDSAEASSQPRMLHIQDAHNHAVAQRNLSRILAALSAGGLWAGDPDEEALVLVEGAWKTVDLEWLRAHPNAAVLQQAAGFLLSRSRMTGEVQAALANRSIAIEGIEDEKIYWENARARRRVEDWSRTLLGAVAAPQSAAEAVTIRGLLYRLYRAGAELYSGDMRNWERERLRYRRGETGASEFLTYARRHLPDQLWAAHAGAAMKQFSELSDLEARLQMERVEKERAELLRRISDEADAPRIQQLARLSLQFRLGRISAVDYYGVLLAAAADAPSRFPALSLYAEYLRRADRLSAETLSEELAAFENHAADFLCRGRAEARRLAELTRWVELQERLWELEMSPHEWAAYEAARGSADWNAVRSALERGGQPRLEGWNGFHSLLAARAGEAEKYYELARRRDAVLSENALRIARSRGARRAFVVAGGFHTPGIASRFRARRVPFAVIRPQLSAPLLVRKDPPARATGTLRDALAYLGVSRDGQPVDLAPDHVGLLESVAAIQLAPEEMAADLDAWKKALAARAASGDGFAEDAIQALESMSLAAVRSRGTQAVLAVFERKNAPPLLRLTIFEDGRPVEMLRDRAAVREWLSGSVAVEATWGNVSFWISNGRITLFDPPALPAEADRVGLLREPEPRPEAAPQDSQPGKPSAALLWRFPRLAGLLEWPLHYPLLFALGIPFIKAVGSLRGAASRAGGNRYSTFEHDARALPQPDAWSFAVGANASLYFLTSVPLAYFSGVLWLSALGVATWMAGAGWVFSRLHGDRQGTRIFTDADKRWLGFVGAALAGLATAPPVAALTLHADPWWIAAAAAGGWILAVAAHTLHNIGVRRGWKGLRGKPYASISPRRQPPDVSPAARGYLLAYLLDVIYGDSVHGLNLRDSDTRWMIVLTELHVHRRRDYAKSLLEDDDLYEDFKRLFSYYFRRFEPASPGADRALMRVVWELGMSHFFEDSPVPGERPAGLREAADRLHALIASESLDLNERVAIRFLDLLERGPFLEDDIDSIVRSMEFGEAWGQDGRILGGQGSSDRPLNERLAIGAVVDNLNRLTFKPEELEEYLDQVERNALFIPLRLQERVGFKAREILSGFLVRRDLNGRIALLRRALEIYRADVSRGSGVPPGLLLPRWIMPWAWLDGETERERLREELRPRLARLARARMLAISAMIAVPGAALAPELSEAFRALLAHPALATFALSGMLAAYANLFSLAHAGPGLKTDGLYRWVRNPTYFFYLAFPLSLLAASPSPETAAFAALFGALALIAALSEELELWVRYGAEYVAYSHRVRSRLIPGLGALGRWVPRPWRPALARPRARAAFGGGEEAFFGWGIVASGAWLLQWIPGIGELGALLIASEASARLYVSEHRVIYKYDGEGNIAERGPPTPEDIRHLTRLAYVLRAIHVALVLVLPFDFFVNNLIAAGAAALIHGPVHNSWLAFKHQWALGIMDEPREDFEEFRKIVSLTRALAKLGYGPLRKAEPREIAELQDEADGRVNVAVYGGWTDDWMAFFKEASRRPDANFIFLTGAPPLELRRVNGRSDLIAREGIVWRGEKMLWARLPSGWRLDRVVDFSTDQWPAVEESAVPSSAHPMAYDYMAEKDVAGGILLDAGVRAPRFISLIHDENMEKGIFERRRRMPEAHRIEGEPAADAARREILAFMGRRSGAEVVVKPNRGSGGKNVVFATRENLETSIGEVTDALSRFARVTVQERILPPLIDGLDWNVRAFVTWDADGRPLLSDWFVRAGKNGRPVNISRGARTLAPEELPGSLGLSDAEYRQLQREIERQSTAALDAIRRAMEDDGWLAPGQVPVDFAGVDLVLRRESGAWAAYVIEINGERSGGMADIDRRRRELISRGRDLDPSLIGRASRDRVAFIIEQARKHRESRPNGPAATQADRGGETRDPRPTYLYMNPVNELARWIGRGVRAIASAAPGLRRAPEAAPAGTSRAVTVLLHGVALQEMALQRKPIYVNARSLMDIIAALSKKRAAFSGEISESFERLSVWRQRPGQPWTEVKLDITQVAARVFLPGDLVYLSLDGEIPREIRDAGGPARFSSSSGQRLAIAGLVAAAVLFIGIIIGAFLMPPSGSDRRHEIVTPQPTPVRRAPSRAPGPGGSPSARLRRLLASHSDPDVPAHAILQTLLDGARLADARELGAFPDGTPLPADLRLERWTPAPADADVSTLESMAAELSPHRAVKHLDVLLDERGRVLAIFPVAPGAPALKYLNLYEFYYSPPPVPSRGDAGRAAGALNERIAERRRAAEDARLQNEKVKAYLARRPDVDTWLPAADTRYIDARIDWASGSRELQSAQFWKSAPDLSAFQPTARNQSAFLWPLFPTVYTPVRPKASDDDYYRALLRQSPEQFDWPDGEDARVLVIGAGSGLDALVAAMQTRGQIWVVDRNPFAIANTRYLFRQAGLEHRLAAFVCDGVTDSEGRPLLRLDGSGQPALGVQGEIVEFDRVLWNMPWHDSRASAQSGLATWDGAPASVLRLLAGALPLILKKSGVAVFWNVPHPDPAGRDEVAMALRTAGAYLSLPVDERDDDRVSRLARPLQSEPLILTEDRRKREAKSVYIVRHANAEAAPADGMQERLMQVIGLIAAAARISPESAAARVAELYLVHGESLAGPLFAVWQQRARLANPEGDRAQYDFALSRLRSESNPFAPLFNAAPSTLKAARSNLSTDAKESSHSPRTTVWQRLARALYASLAASERGGDDSGTLRTDWPAMVSGLGWAVFLAASHDGTLWGFALSMIGFAVGLGGLAWAGFVRPLRRWLNAARTAPTHAAVPAPSQAGDAASASDLAQRIRLRDLAAMSGITSAAAAAFMLLGLFAAPWLALPLIYLAPQLAAHVFQGARLLAGRTRELGVEEELPSRNPFVRAHGLAHRFLETLGEPGQRLSRRELLAVHPLQLLFLWKALNEIRKESRKAARAETRHEESLASPYSGTLYGGFPLAVLLIKLFPLAAMRRAVQASPYYWRLFFNARRHAGMRQALRRLLNFPIGVHAGGLAEGIEESARADLSDQATAAAELLLAMQPERAQESLERSLLARLEDPSLRDELTAAARGVVSDLQSALARVSDIELESGSANAVAALRVVRKLDGGRRWGALLSGRLALRPESIGLRDWLAGYVESQLRLRLEPAFTGRVPSGVLDNWSNARPVLKEWAERRVLRLAPDDQLAVQGVGAAVEAALKNANRRLRLEAQSAAMTQRATWSERRRFVSSEAMAPDAARIFWAAHRSELLDRAARGFDYGEPAAERESFYRLLGMLADASEIPALEQLARSGLLTREADADALREAIRQIRTRFAEPAVREFFDSLRALVEEDRFDALAAATDPANMDLFLPQRIAGRLRRAARASEAERPAAVLRVWIDAHAEQGWDSESAASLRLALAESLRRAQRPDEALFVLHEIGNTLVWRDSPLWVPYYRIRARAHRDLNRVDFGIRDLQRLAERGRHDGQTAFDLARAWEEALRGQAEDMERGQFDLLLWIMEETKFLESAEQSLNAARWAARALLEWRERFAQREREERDDVARLARRFSDPIDPLQSHAERHFERAIRIAKIHRYLGRADDFTAYAELLAATGRAEKAAEELRLAAGDTLVRESDRAAVLQAAERVEAGIRAEELKGALAQVFTYDRSPVLLRELLEHLADAELTRELRRFQTLDRSRRESALSRFAETYGLSGLELEQLNQIIRNSEIPGRDRFGGPMRLDWAAAAAGAGFTILMLRAVPYESPLLLGPSLVGWIPFSSWVGMGLAVFGLAWMAARSLWNALAALRDRSAERDGAFEAAVNRVPEYGPILREIERRAGGLRGRRLLELGAGPGVLVAALSSLPGVSVTGVEARPRSVALAQLNSIPLVQSDLRDVPRELKRRRFDVTFSRLWLDALAAADANGTERRLDHAGELAVLRTIFRLTRPGGWSIHETRSAMPFTDEEFRRAGFEVVHVNADRTMAVLRSPRFAKLRPLASRAEELWRLSRESLARLRWMAGAGAIALAGPGRAPFRAFSSGASSRAWRGIAAASQDRHFARIVLANLSNLSGSAAASAHIVAPAAWTAWLGALPAIGGWLTDVFGGGTHVTVQNGEPVFLLTHAALGGLFAGSAAAAESDLMLRAGQVRVLRSMGATAGGMALGPGHAAREVSRVLRRLIRSGSSANEAETIATQASGPDEEALLPQTRAAFAALDARRTRASDRIHEILELESYANAQSLARGDVAVPEILIRAIQDRLRGGAEITLAYDSSAWNLDDRRREALRADIRSRLRSAGLEKAQLHDLAGNSQTQLLRATAQRASVVRVISARDTSSWQAAAELLRKDGARIRFSRIQLQLIPQVGIRVIFTGDDARQLHEWAASLGRPLPASEAELDNFVLEEVPARIEGADALRQNIVLIAIQA